MESATPIHETETLDRSRRRWLSVSLLVVLLLLIFFGLITQRRSAIANPALPTPVPAGITADDALIRANEANIRADAALDSIDKILAIIQVLSVVFVIASALIGFLGYREFNDEIAEVRKLQTDMKKVLSDIEDVRELLDQIDFIRKDNERLRSEMGTDLAALRVFRDELANNLQEVDRHINDSYQAGALSQLAQRQITLGNISAAAKIFQDVCALDPDNPIYQYFLGDLLIRQGRIGDGIEHLRSARQDNYKYPSADASYAYALRLRGDEESDLIRRETLYYESGEIFLGVYQIDPELVDISGESVFGALAGLYRRQGRHGEALKWYEHCRNITPHNSYPVNNLAVLHFHLGNQTEAQKYFKLALVFANEKLALRSSDYWSRFDLITANAALGESPQAVAAELEKLHDVAVGPLKKFLYGLEDLRQAQNPPSGVMDTLDQIIERVKAEIEGRGGAGSTQPSAF